MPTSSPAILVREAYHHNLKNITTSIKPGEVTVITGLSGSGKSTLLFDVLHAEGQRKYVETFSPYMRQFLDTLPRPKVKEILNARPSIAVEQKNSIRNSRSTIGTMTGLCDYFKVWFTEVASLIDPITGDIISKKNVSEETERILETFSEKQIICGFTAKKPTELTHIEFVSLLRKAGHNRILVEGKYQKLNSLNCGSLNSGGIFVVIDKISISEKNSHRLLESLELSLSLGKGRAEIRDLKGNLVDVVVSGLRSKANDRKFENIGPDSFSFNSPRGACSKCKGFGKSITIDPSKVIPNPSLSILDNAIKPFTGKIYGHCKLELIDHLNSIGVDCTNPFEKLNSEVKNFVWNGTCDYDNNKSGWYGINRFFSWLEKKTYKMHVRVFLSKFRDYFTCNQCNGTRLKNESLNWRWKGLTLPSLYAQSVSKLLETLPKETNPKGNRESVTLSGIRTRLKYLEDVGLGYLTLDRPSKTLSGGETQRVNLTTCLGSELTDALFALDEPTIGLHAKDVGRLIGVLRKLADAGNCVCVVEHDEEVIRSADNIIELGPVAGLQGGEIVFQGTASELQYSNTLTGRHLYQKKGMDKFIKSSKVSFKKSGSLKIKNASLHNLREFSATLPLGKFVCIAGISGSGKSTLINEIVYKSLANGTGDKVICDKEYDEVLLINQETITKTPRSNPILYIDGWTPIRDALGRTNEAKKLGYSAIDFSFNSGNGRCPECSGLGFEIVEMQFLSDVQIECSQCNGLRFKDDILTVTFEGNTVADILQMTIDQAAESMKNLPKTAKRLKLLQELGLGYLSLGQPLNTLSGGESQRLKLVKHMGKFSSKKKHSIIFIDEPTTGLHMEDVSKLIKCLRNIVEAGNSLFIIEHNKQMLLSADWILELGPGAGAKGGKLVSNGTPKDLKSKRSNTSNALFRSNVFERQNTLRDKSQKSVADKNTLKVIGASENNLKNISLEIPLNKMVVVTGPSGSGKSSLAFNVIFAEGQRRFMESMSSYARQFTDQLNRPKVDKIEGMPPTIAIEQRVNRGTRKSTVGTVTEIAQYLRLLYAKLGTQLSCINGKRLVELSLSQLVSQIRKQLRTDFANTNSSQILVAPLVTGRKGHHRPIVNWASQQGYDHVVCDGMIYSTKEFQGLDRYVSHDIELVIENWDRIPSKVKLKSSIKVALEVGNGRCALLNYEKGSKQWYSMKRVDQETGQAYPELEPSLFSWNSSKGMCQFCKGYGKIYEWMKDELPATKRWWTAEDGQECPECKGERLSSVPRNVVLFDKAKQQLSLPKLISNTPEFIINFLKELHIEDHFLKISQSIIPEIIERLNFMNIVGLDYLCLDRETSTLSGGESQRIRLAAQLGSNMSGVLYVLDEPSIGLHPVDNQRLIDSLKSLNKKGNSLLVVEHDQEMVESSDFRIEIGPEAGERGGKLKYIGPQKNKRFIINDNLCSYSREKNPLPKGKLSKRTTSWIKLRKVNFRNLNNISVDIPVGCLSVCCGISGSGKSSLVRGILLPKIKEAIGNNGKVVKFSNGEVVLGAHFNKAIEVDQNPIGKTSRSTPVTYLGIWEKIRGLFSLIAESKARGYSASTFSFNTKGGRCEKCNGNGKIKIEMNFLPDTHIKCDICNGTRFKEEILDIKWKDRNIYEVLELTVEEAVNFFDFDHYLKSIFKLMLDTGLGYLKLGQPSPSLSGGEAQRLKLCSELSKSIEKKRSAKTDNGNFMVLEEPTIGLHDTDKTKLFDLLDRLVRDGNTIVVIEHDTELIAMADYAIEIGPGGGKYGGEIMFQGLPEHLSKSKNSPTAPFLQNHFSNLR